MVSLPLEHVYVEPDAPADGPAPAVVVMHGRGADERDLLPVVDRLPDELAAVSLRAPDPIGQGYRWYEIDASDGLHESQPHPEEYRRSLDLVRESIDGAVEGYDLDPDRLGLLGFSMGAMLSMGLLLEDPGAYDWIAGLHGYLPASHADRSPEGVEDKPVFLAAGATDRIIPPERVERAADRFRALGAAVAFSVYDVGHGIGPAELGDLIGFVRERLD
ncbi:MAG: alpha/beta hydrolase [Haloferacaceae archaeon]